LDAGICARPGCGNPLLPGRKLEDVCSYACRGQMKVEAIQGQTGLSGSKNINQNKALQSLKRQSVGVPTFAKISSCTYRVDSPKKNGAGWLMEVAFARVGNRASEPLALDEAKRAVVAMLRERKETETRDWIAELNTIAAAEFDRVALLKERKQWPRDLLGGSRRGSMHTDREQRNSILSAELVVPSTLMEPLSGDEYQLTYDADGNVELPACLDRQKPKPGATSQSSETTQKPSSWRCRGLR
jgi:hypothetical protein